VLLTRFPIGGWRPNSDRQPLLWLRADQGISVSAGKVVSWTDISGHGWVFDARTSGNRPAYSATGWNSAQPGVVFGSAYTEMKNQAAGLANLGTSLSVRVHAVWTVASHSSTQKFCAWINNGGGSGVYEIQVNSSHNDEVAYSSGGTVHTGSTLTGAHVTEHVMNQYSTGYTLSKIDGVGSISSATSTPTSATDTLIFGGNMITGSAALDGTVAEIVVYDTSAGDYDVADRFRAYAKSQWGGLS
jgi:hypothetical protein